MVAPNPIPQAPKDRFEVYRFFDGLSEEGRENRARLQGRVPMVKTFLLEHVSAHGERAQKPVETIFCALGCELSRVDESFWVLRAPITHPGNQQPSLEVVGYLETYDKRFFAFYTAEKAGFARHLVNRWTTVSADLDATWFSSQLLQVLWQRDVQHRGDGRFTKLVFKHESIFEMPEDATDAEVNDEALVEALVEPDPDYDEANPDDAEAARGDDESGLERRNARFEMGDRIGRVRASLGALQKQYEPLNALYSLRFPSQVGPGCNDLYQHGQITNRAGGFLDHRNTVRYFHQLYNSVLDETERVAWARDEHETGGARVRLKGVPLIVRFSEPLNEATFNRWVGLAFQKRNRFRLWGDPVRLGPTKVHVYGADRHLWQPINIEMSAEGLTAILPQGTCGNTFHRLVTNLQRYVSPQVQAWLGSRAFSDLVGVLPARETSPAPRRD